MKDNHPRIKFIEVSLLAILVLALAVSCVPAMTEIKSITVSGQVLPENETNAIQLPEASRIIVQVQDTGKADASAVVLGEQIITGKISLPTAYEINVNQTDLEEAGRASVSARIEDADGNLLYINDTIHMVSMEKMTVDVVVIPLTSNKSASSLPSAFDDKVWQWLAFQDSASGEESNDITVDNPTQYTLQLLTDGTYTFKADCNVGSGEFTLKDSTLTFAPGIMTLAACDPDSLSDQYVALLADVVTFTFDAQGYLNLNLKMDAGNLIFAPAPAAANPLSDTTWTLKSITVEGSDTSSEIDTEITAEFKDGQISGSAGCNRYFGNVEITDSSLAISALGSTLMFCDQARNQRESEFLTALQSVTGYQLDDDMLILVDADGNALIEMTARE